MSYFKRKPGTKSAIRILKNPFPDIAAFNAVVQSIVLKNPLGCTSYQSDRKNHPPVWITREQYTAKFAYLNTSGKRIGTGLDMYDSVEGYENGIAAVISNMANIAAHRGKVRHMADADLFSILLNCHDPEGEVYLLGITRNQLTLASYRDDRIRMHVEAWAGTVPALA